MRWITTFFLSFLGYVCYGQTMTADTAANARVFAEIYFDWGIPLGKYGDNMNTNGVGVGGEFLYRVQGPAWIGVGAHSFRFDNYGITYIEYFDNEPVELEEVAASRAVMAHVLMRFQPIHHPIFTPYLQAGVGWHWFYTNTKIKDIEFDEIVDSFGAIRDDRFGYTLQAGSLVTIPYFPNMGLDFRVGYVANASVEYMTIDPDRELGSGGGYPIEYFATTESVVDLLSIQIGFFLRI